MSTYIKSICLAFSFLLTIGVANATITPKKADFVFIVDASGSVLNEITAIKNGLSQFANGLDQAQVDAQFAIVLIGQEPEIVLQMTSSTADVESAFNSISVYGAVSGFQNSHYLNPEAGLEAIRMVLGAANNSVISHEYVGGNGSISFRPDSRKNLILVTDENSDMPFYEENRVAGQTYTEPPYYNFTDSAWQQEINNTAQIVIDNNAYVNLLVNPYDFSTKNQYGSPASDVADVNLLNYDPAATRAKLIQDGYGESLQAQVLGAGLIARSFDINKVSTSSFVDNFFAAKVEEVSKQELIPSILVSHNPTLVDYTVTLDGSNSAHQDTARQVVLWEWDLDDDGVFEATGLITQTNFAEEGDYTVKLRVTDDGEQPETAEAYVVIKAVLPHQKPVANAGGPYNFCLNEEQWNLDGGKSFNPDDGLHEEGSPEDKIIAYVWELDGNNDYLDADGINPEVKIQLGELELGNYPVKLRVTDNTAESFPSSGLSNQSDTAISTFSIRDESDLLCSCLPELTLEYSYSVFGPKVDLAWNDQNAEGFNVYRSATATGQYELLTAVPVITTSFIDEEVEYEQTYYYQVSKLDIDNNAICKSIKVSINIPSYYNTNYAPIISSEPVLAANEDALYQYDVNATDYNYGDVITYSLEMAPSGMNIDANTGMIEWTPVNAQVGEHTVRVIASDQHGAKDTQIFTVQVGDFNQPPEITSTPLLMITETDNYQYSVLAFDPDMEDDLTYSLVQFPAGMVINSTTGDISWQTETGTVGVFAVEVLVSDSHGATDNQVFDIIVIPLNRPPVIISTAPETGKEEELYQYQVLVEDPDADDIHTYSLEVNPEGMQIDAVTGLITWTPFFGQAGEHPVKVVVTDEGGLLDLQEFAIDVEQKNLAPEITSVPVKTAVEGELYQYQISAKDINEDQLEYNLIQNPEEMNIDSSTGLISWVADSSYSLGETAVDNQCYELVENEDSGQEVDPNRIEISFDDFSNTSALMINGNAIDLTANAEEPVLRLTKDLSQSGSAFTAETIPLVDEKGFKASFSSKFSFRISDPIGNSQSDGQGADGIAFVIQTVNNNTGGIGGGIGYAGIPNSVIIEFDTWNNAGNGIAEDDGNHVGININGNLDSLVYKPYPVRFNDGDIFYSWVDYNGETQLIEVRISQDDIRPEEAYMSYTVDLTEVLEVQDAYVGFTSGTGGAGGTHDILSWHFINSYEPINAIKNNLADLFVKSAAISSDAVTIGIGNRGLYSSIPVNVKVFHGAPEAGGVLLSAQSLPPIESENEYELSVNVDAAALQNDIYVEIVGSEELKECHLDNNKAKFALVDIKVSDPEGLFDSQKYLINVHEGDLPPAFVELNTNQSFKAEEPYSYVVVTTDPNKSDSVAYRLVNAPDGMEINPVTGEITWDTTQADVGEYVVTVEIEDINGNVVSEEILITVLDNNQAPEITSTPETTAFEAHQYYYQLIAEDPNADDVITFTKENGSVDTTSGGLAAWRPISSDAGTDGKSPEVCMTDIPEIGTFKPVKKWSWTGSDILPNYHYAAAPSMVAQTSDDNGDGSIDGNDIPDIIFATYNINDPRDKYKLGYLRIVSGKDGSLLATNQDYELNAYVSLAVADIDDDGLVEILAERYGGGVVAFENDGTFKWEKINANSFTAGGISVADLDGDGSVEILGTEDVLDGAGNVLFELTEAGGGPIGPITFAADINLDGKQEIIKWPYVYSSQGEQLWKANAGNGFAAVGNFDEDDYAEIVGVSDGKVYLYNHDGTAIFANNIIPGGGRGGAPTIADMDGDGEPEIGVAGSNYYVVYETNGSILWQSATEDDSSHVTGSSVFDFNGDGKVEVVYADEYFLRVYDGATGNIIYQVKNRSHTVYENPVIADIDNDNHAEIIITSSERESGYEYGIRVFEDANDSWMPTRKIWNQHAYSIDNINDDGTVPTTPVKGWLTHNSFRLNAFAERDAREIADLTLKDILWDEQTNSISVTVVNGGKAPSVQTTLSIYNGDPSAGGTLLGDLQVQSVAGGQGYVASLELQEGLANIDKVFAVIDSEDVSLECDENNNEHFAHVTSFKVTDVAGLTDIQTYTLNVLPLNYAPVITSQAPGVVFYEDLYEYTVTAEDLDSEDVLSYVLESAPERMRINFSTGHIGWYPAAEDIGNHTVKIKVVDNSGAFDTQTYILTVQDANRAPYFISQPVTTAIEGVRQSYQVEAADPNIGDVFAFNKEEGPMAMSADGSVYWIPTSDLAGTDAKSPEICMTDIPEIGSIAPVKKWSWTGSDIKPDYDVVVMTPVVGQTNDDNGDGEITEEDIPDVIFSTFNLSTHTGSTGEGYLRIASGSDGSLITTNVDYLVEGYAPLAIADIDGDGLIEIMASRYPTGIVVFEHDGTFKWENDQSGDFKWGGPSVADLNGDGIVEIIAADVVLDPQGNILFQIAGTGGGTAGPIPVVADINLDGEQEIIKWPHAYSANGQLLWTAPSSNGFSAIGNFDEDDYPEIAVVVNGTVGLYDHEGNVVFSNIAIPGGGKGGAPTIADMDGDGMPEIGVAGANRYVVFNHDGSILWESLTKDNSSHKTGSSVFDFDGDGQAEIVYADEYFLRVYNGKNGNVIYEVKNRSITTYENPVIVDIDNDNHAEIIICANGGDAGYEYGIRVFEDANDSWMPTRKIWNQHAYSIDNINDDGTVPANPDKGWLTHNSFRLNAFTERDARDIADLSLKDILWDEQTNTISVTVVNGGKAPSIATDVVLYNGDPEAEGTVIGTIDVLPLHASGQQTYELEVPAGIEGLEQVYAVVDSQNTTEECLEANNKHLAHVSKFTVTDQKGLSGSQTFLLNVIPDNSAPQITSQPVSEFYFSKNNNVEAVWIDTHGNKESNEVYGAYSLKEGYKYKVSVRGTYTVWTNPGGTEQGIPESTPIYPSAGAANDKVYFDSQFAFGYPYSHESFTEFPARVSQFKFSLNNGDDWNHAISPTDYNLQHKYDYVVTGESYPFGIKLFDHPYNDNSGMLKVDINTAEDGVVYVYKVQAADVDGDELTYLLVSAPKGMSIDPESGEIEWLPDVNSLGKFKVVVKVADSHGMYAIQSYTVETFMGNKNPEITTQPLTVGAVGIPYVYDVDATDEDGDAVSFSLTASSLPGLVIDAETGVLSYTPTAEDLGVHSVTITADDSFGGKAYQSYNLMISQEVNNPPGISSTPDTIAVAGQEYTYQVEADDPDGDALNYSVDAGDITEVSIESETGLLSWTPTLDNVGTHMVEVTVDDGRGGYVIQKYSLAVIDGAANNPPEITTTPTFYAYVDTQYTYDIDATDIDNDSLEYLLIEGPEGMVVDSVSGMITYTASIDQKGEYTVQVQANDGRSGSSTQTYSLFVIEEGENHPPVINSAAPINGEIDQLYSYDANAIDEDSDPLVYSLLVSPAGMTIDQNSGLVEWTPTAEQLGEHAIKVQAEDGRGGLSTQQYTLTITEDINYDPVIASSPNTQTLINQSYIYDVNATDTDGDTLSYSVSPKPDGMSINSSSGFIEWTPSNEQAGSYILTVSVEDGNGGEAQQIYTLTVSASDLPYLANEPTDTATVDEYYRYRIYALDADGYSVNIELINGPDGMVLQDVNGYPTLQWFPEQDNCEEFVTLRLTDRLSRVAEVTYGIRVYAVTKKLNRIQCSQENASCNN